MVASKEAQKSTIESDGLPNRDSEAVTSFGISLSETSSYIKQINRWENTKSMLKTGFGAGFPTPSDITS